MHDDIYGTVIRSWPDIDPEIEYSESTTRYKDLGNLEPFIGPQRPRPAVTAWEGADLDAYYLADETTWTWLHCQTGRKWVVPVSLNDATTAFCNMLMERNGISTSARPGSDDAIAWKRD